MREENNLQGTGEWFSARCGKLTASRMAAAMAFLKNGNEAAARKDLKVEILAERLTDNILQKYVTAEMQWGIDHEAMAKEAFEKRTNQTVRDVGFVDHPVIEYFGASPDGLTSDGSCIEVKCPKTTTHLNYLLDGGVPENHKPQMIVQSACTGRPVWFVSFDPRLPEKQQLFMVLYEPTPGEISHVEAQAMQFLSELDSLFDRITQEEL
jgi:putative phage-type endonuclease